MWYEFKMKHSLSQGYWFGGRRTVPEEGRKVGSDGGIGLKTPISFPYVKAGQPWCSFHQIPLFSLLLSGFLWDNLFRDNSNVM